jgi:hypothetical protein
MLKSELVVERNINIWGVTINGHTHFFMKIAMSDLENSHKRPFSIILEANTYGF